MVSRESSRINKTCQQISAARKSDENPESFDPECAANCPSPERHGEEEWNAARDWRNPAQEELEDEDGNILVELALILPTCMMVLTGIFSFAFAYSNELMLTNAVGSGATYLQQNAPYTTDPCSDALTKIEAAAPSLIASNINLTLTINNGTPVTGSSCQSSASSLNTATGIPVNVSATYPCNIHVLNFTISPTCKLTAQTTEYVY